MSDTTRTFIGVLFGVGLVIVIALITPAIARSIAWLWKTRRRSDLSRFTVYTTPQGKTRVGERGPRQRPAECRHSSKRADGLLDNHCMLCGADGYWLDGQRIDFPHPGGKTLLRIDRDLGR